MLMSDSPTINNEVTARFPFAVVVRDNRPALQETGASFRSFRCGDRSLSWHRLEGRGVHYLNG